MRLARCNGFYGNGHTSGRADQIAIIVHCGLSVCDGDHWCLWHDHRPASRSWLWTSADRVPESRPWGHGLAVSL